MEDEIYLNRACPTGCPGNIKDDTRTDCSKYENVYDAIFSETELAKIVAELTDKVKELEKENEQGWISVENQQPEEDQYVLVYRPSRNLIVAIQCVRWWWGDEQDFTHWMPLPSAPK